MRKLKDDWYEHRIGTMVWRFRAQSDAEAAEKVKQQESRLKSRGGQGLKMTTRNSLKMTFGK